MEGFDDAEHGSEQTDERRVRSQRRQIRQVAFEAKALLCFGPFHGAFMSGLEVARAIAFALEERADVLEEPARIRAMGREVPEALDHDSEADDAPRNQEPEHPAGAMEREGEESRGKVHLRSPMLLLSCS